MRWPHRAARRAAPEGCRRTRSSAARMRRPLHQKDGQVGLADNVVALARLKTNARWERT